jgi:hypothetical protein
MARDIIKKNKYKNYYVVTIKSEKPLKKRLNKKELAELLLKAKTTVEGFGWDEL